MVAFLLKNTKHIYPQEKNEKLIHICKEFHADKYICGSGGLTYIDIDKFIAHGIEVVLEDWNESSMKEKYDLLEWRNICFLDFWARYGFDELLMVIGGNNG